MHTIHHHHIAHTYPARGLITRCADPHVVVSHLSRPSSPPVRSAAHRSVQAHLEAFVVPRVLVSRLSASRLPSRASALPSLCREPASQAKEADSVKVSSWVETQALSALCFIPWTLQPLCVFVCAHVYAPGEAHCYIHNHGKTA
jgi:hypothetical protein